MALKLLSGKLQLLSRGSGDPSASFHLDLPFDISRTWVKAKSLLLDVQVEELWDASKARAKQLSAQLCHRGGSGGSHSSPEPLLTAHQTGTQQQEAATSAAAAAASAEEVPQAVLDEMYGSNGVLRSAVLSVIGHASQAFMHQANSVTVEGGEHVRAALDRPAGQALITVCNHVAALDDPLVVASLLPADLLDQPDRLRWTLCATDRCFKYKMLAPFFTAAKVLPVQRGAGLSQPGMVAAEKRLQQGDWVQVFPEGTRSRDPTRMSRVRPGVGRLVAAAASTPGAPAPIVLPFAHAGMEHVLPVGQRLPSIGQQVQVVVGEPVQVADLLQQAREERWEQSRLYSAIAARVESSLEDLHARAKHKLAFGATRTSTSSSASRQGEGSAAGTEAASWSERAGSHQAAAGSSLGSSSQSQIQQQQEWLTDSGRQRQRPRGTSGGGGGGLWGPAQLLLWERAAFSIWHRGWAERLAVVQATSRALYAVNEHAAGPAL